MTDSAQSENLLEIGAEVLHPAKWAAMQLVKGGRPDMTAGEAFDMIEATVTRAIERAQGIVSHWCRDEPYGPGWWWYRNSTHKESVVRVFTTADNELAFNHPIGDAAIVTNNGGEWSSCPVRVPDGGNTPTEPTTPAGELRQNAKYCDRCDGCGTVDGGEALETTCDYCGGSGLLFTQGG